MEVSPIAVPYHLGRPDVGAARGPDRILRAVAARRLALPEIRVSPAQIFANEVAASIHVDAVLADRVRRELADGRTPVTISADCFSCLGTIGGLGAATQDGARRIGVVWLDAHGDFNTASTSPTGYLDGMALSAAVGLEWGAVSSSIPGFRPVAASNVVHLGGRDFDPGEAARLEHAGAVLIGPSELGAAAEQLDRALDSLAARTDVVYLHVDLDVLDPSAGIANGYSSPGGLAADGLLAVVGACLAKLPVGAIAFTAYDPDFDPSGAVAAVAARLMEELAGAGLGQSRL